MTRWRPWSTLTTRRVRPPRDESAELPGPSAAAAATNTTSTTSTAFSATTASTTTESDYNCYYYVYCCCFFYQQLLLHPGQSNPSCELEVLLRRTIPVTMTLSLLPQNRGVLLHSYSLNMGLLLESYSLNMGHAPKFLLLKHGAYSYIPAPLCYLPMVSHMYSDHTVPDICALKSHNQNVANIKIFVE